MVNEPDSLVWEVAVVPTTLTVTPANGRFFSASFTVPETVWLCPRTGSEKMKSSNTTTLIHEAIFLITVFLVL
jgi:hypothetical protein